jgi:uncharacterized protein YecT (DUF1311 family)
MITDTSRLRRNCGQPLSSLRTKPALVSIALLSCSLSFPPLKGEAADQSVLQSPDGTFELLQIVPENDTDDIQFFLVSKTNPKERTLLAKEPAISGNTWSISSDSNWLLDSVRDVHKVAHMELYRRVAGLKFDRIRNFSDRAWASLSSKRKYSKGEEGIMDFVSWSPDNTRLLISLRGPVHGDENDKPWFTDWSVYFNLQTQKFEYTPYLDRWNSQVFKLAFDQNYDELTSLAPASAEPLADTVSEAEWNKRLTEADDRLNNLYHQALAKLSSTDATRLRSDEVAWIKKRDRITADFAKQGTPPNPILRRLQSLVDLTNARCAQLKEEWSSGEAE